MPLKIGSTNISAVYAGSTKIARIYKGAALVYSSETWASLALKDIHETLIDPGYGNRLLPNSSGTFGIAYGGTISVSNDKATVTTNGTNNVWVYHNPTMTAVANHIYLASSTVTASVSCSFWYVLTVNYSYVLHSLTAGAKTVVDEIMTASNGTTSGYTLGVRFNAGTDVSGETIVIENMMLFDLTAIFGAGNEPTSASDPRIKLLKQQKAKALRFDEVYGNGLVMNQLVQNGNFEDGSYWPSSNAQCSLTIANNEMTLETLVEGYAQSKEQINNPQYLYADHKYLVSYWAKGSLGSGAEGTSATVIRVSIKLYSYNNSATIFNQDYVDVSSAYRQISSIVQPTQTTSGGAASGGFRVYYQSNTGRSYVGDTVSVKKFNVFDLTLMFGTGNEPTSTDDPRVKKLLDGYFYVTQQIVKNGNFNGTTDWNGTNGTISASGNVLTYSIATVGDDFASNRINQNQNSINGHKYLVSVFVKAPYQTDIRGYTGNFFVIGTAVANSWTHLSSIVSTNSANGNNHLYFDVHDQASYQVGDTIQVKEYQKFDLTTSFGAGNEPTSVNDPRVVALISSYHDYGNVNHYEPTDITSVWTEPFNIFDGIWDVGSFDNNYATNAKSINYLPVCGGETYIFDNGDLVTTNSNGFYYQEFDENLNALNAARIALYDVFTSANKQTQFTVKQGCRYIKFFIYIANYDFTHNFPQHVTIRRKSNRLGYHMLSDINLLASLSSRSKGTLSGFANTTPRAFSESEYYVGLTRDNYYGETGVGSYFVSTNFVTVTSANSGYGVAFPVKASPNASYSFSCSASPSSSGNTGIGVTFYDGTGNIISYTQQEDSATSKSLSGTAPSDCAWISILFYATSAAGATTYGNISLNVTPRYAYESLPQSRNLCDKKSFSQYDYSYDYLKYNANNSVFLQAGTYTFTTGHGVYIQFYNSPSDSDYITAAGAISYQSAGDATLWNGRGVSTVNDTEITLTLKVDCFVTVCGRTNSGPVINPMINAGNVAYPYVPYDDKLIPNYLDGQKSILGVQNVPFTYGANAANVSFYPRTDGSFAVGSSDALRKNAKKISGHKYFILITVDNAVYSWAYLGIWDTTSSGYADRLAPTQIGNDFYALVTATSSVDNAVPTFQFGGTNNTAMTCRRAIILDVTGTPLENQSSHKIYAMLKGIDDLAAGLELHGALEMAQWPHLQLNGAIDAHDSLAITDESYVFTKRVASVDMSKINWSYQSDHGRFYSSGVQSLIKGNTNGAVVPNISCPKLTSISLNNIDTSDNVTSVYNNMVFFRSTSAGTTSQEAQAFLNGVVLHYELATPQEISIPKEKTAVVDLGSLNWGTVSSTSGTRFYTTSQLVGNANNQSYTAIPNIYCSRYITEDFNHTPSTEGIGTYNSYIYLNSATYSVVADFKEAMSGEYLFYETTYPMLEETEYEASVDLGTLNGYMSNDIYYCADALNPPFAYPTASTANDGYKATIKGYTRAKGNEVAAKTNDKTFCLTSPYLGGNLAIYDSKFAGKTINEVKAMLSGKKIVFETAAKASTPQHSVMKVDLGSLTWSYVGSNYTAYTTGLSALVSRPSSYSVLSNAYCDSLMIVAEGNITAAENTIAISTGGNVLIKASSLGASADQIKASLSGVYLYFDSVVQKARIPNEVKAEYGGVVSTDSEVLPDADISLKF